MAASRQASIDSLSSDAVINVAVWFWLEWWSLITSFIFKSKQSINRKTVTEGKPQRAEVGVAAGEVLHEAEGGLRQWRAA